MFSMNHIRDMRENRKSWNGSRFLNNATILSYIFQNHAHRVCTRLGEHSSVGLERLLDKPEVCGSNPLVPTKKKPLIVSGFFRWYQSDNSLSSCLARESLSDQPASGVMVANPESSVSSCSSRDAASGVPAAANSFFRIEIFSAS